MGNAPFGLSLAVHGQQVYAGAVADLSGGLGGPSTLSPLWRWDGVSWARLGVAGSWKRVVDGQEAFPLQVNDLILREDQLFVGGDFTEAGGIPSRRIVRFDTRPTTYAGWIGIHFAPGERGDPALAGADADPDGDGMTNQQEFEAGTDPRNGESRFEVEPMLVGGSGGLFYFGAIISFEALPLRTYTVQFRDGFGVTWQRFADIPARDIARTERIYDQTPGASQRLYRIVTPALP
jgi:hypothetical protein